MPALIALFGVLQAVGGMLFYAAAKSAIHEILAATSFGLGILSLALSAALQELKRIRTATERHADAMEVLRSRAEPRVD